MKRRAMTRRQSAKSYRRGKHVNKRNNRGVTVRGGIRL